MELGRKPGEFRLGIIVGEAGLFSLGIGEQAIKLALSEARKTIPIEKLHLDVRLDDQRAIACYQKCGFKISGYGVKQETDGGELRYSRMEVHLAQAR